MGEPSKVVVPIFGILDVTGEVIMMWAIILILAVISIIVTRSLKEKPGAFQNVIECGLEYLENFFSGILSPEKARKYRTFLCSLFIFIVFANYSGLFPGVGLTPYFKAPTSSLSVTLGLGCVVFCVLQYAGLRSGVKHYFKRFVSPMFFMLPLLVLDEFIKPASLALRLYGNIFGEETVTEQLYELIPVGVPAIMMGLSLLFCAIQAIVYTMLTSIYLDEVTDTEE